jgi:hypothetical protein
MFPKQRKHFCTAKLWCKFWSDQSEGRPIRLNYEAASLYRKRTLLGNTRNRAPKLHFNLLRYQSSFFYKCDKVPQSPNINLKYGTAWKLRSSERRRSGLGHYGMQRCVDGRVAPDVSKYNSAFNFRIKQKRRLFPLNSTKLLDKLSTSTFTGVVVWKTFFVITFRFVTDFSLHQPRTPQLN